MSIYTPNIYTWTLIIIADVGLLNYNKILKLASLAKDTKSPFL